MKTANTSIHFLFGRLRIQSAARALSRNGPDNSRTEDPCSR